MICAGSVSKDILADACFADSGGALVCAGYAVGIISQGINVCGIFEYPTVNTNISSFTKWINENSVTTDNVLPQYFLPEYIIVCFFVLCCVCVIIFSYYLLYDTFWRVRRHRSDQAASIREQKNNETPLVQ